MATKDWGNIQSYLDIPVLKEDEPQDMPIILTGEKFAFTGGLLDVDGNEIEPEHPPAEFTECLYGLMPQSISVPYSTQKAPYLLEIYESVPKWLGMDTLEMQHKYGYTPDELSESFAAQRGPSSEHLQNILRDLIERAEALLRESDPQYNASGPEENL